MDLNSDVAIVPLRSSAMGITCLQHWTLV